MNQLGIRVKAPSYLICTANHTPLLSPPSLDQGRMHTSLNLWLEKRCFYGQNGTSTRHLISLVVLWLFFPIFIKKISEISIRLFGSDGSVLSTLLSAHLPQMTDPGNAWCIESRLECIITVLMFIEEFVCVLSLHSFILT